MRSDVTSSSTRITLLLLAAAVVGACRDSPLAPHSNGSAIAGRLVAAASTSTPNGPEECDPWLELDWSCDDPDPGDSCPEQASGTPTAPGVEATGPCAPSNYPGGGGGDGGDGGGYDTGVRIEYYDDEPLADTIVVDCTKNHGTGNPCRAICQGVLCFESAKSGPT